jgi:hypothetical protein
MTGPLKNTGVGEKLGPSTWSLRRVTGSRVGDSDGPDLLGISVGDMVGASVGATLGYSVVTFLTVTSQLDRRSDDDCNTT